MKCQCICTERAFYQLCLELKRMLEINTTKDLTGNLI